MDLSEAIWGTSPWSARRLWALLKHLPRESAVAKAMAPQGAAEWTNTEELLATLCELVDAGNRTFVKAHSKPGSQEPKPIRITRPWQRAEPRKPSPKDEVVAFFTRR